MKKLIAYLLVAMMCLSSLVACGEAEETSDLKAASDYVYAMYKDKGTTYAKDFERTAQVMIGTTKYAVEWTVDTDKVKVTNNGTKVVIDVDEKSEEELKFVLTATVKDAEGNKESVSFNYVVPKYEGYAGIVKEAYKLEAGQAMDGTYTLEGVITNIDTAWSADYGNITVTIQVGDLTDMPIMCYRLAPIDKANAEEVAKCAGLAVGDKITVTGSIKNYNGTIEFDQGCTLDALEKNADAPVINNLDVPADATMEQIVDLAYTLDQGAQFTSKVTLTGVITKIDTAFSEQYGNVSVSIQVGDKADKIILCYRMKGDGASTIAVGDTITCTGTIKNYKGTIEFDAGCTLDSYTSAGGSTDTPADTPAGELTQAQIMDLVDALEEGATLDGTYKLTGIVLEVSEVSSYGDVNVTMKVVDAGDRTIYCYGVKGEGNTDIKVGDTITVEGTLKNYKGTKEFHLPQMTERVPGEGGTTEEPAAPSLTTAEEILKAAYKLADKEYLGGSKSEKFTLTGVITVVTDISAEYKNATVTMVVDNLTDYPIVVFRVKGDGYDTLEVGKTITVTGSIMNYGGTVEFDSGCTLDAVK